MELTLNCRHIIRVGHVPLNSDLNIIEGREHDRREDVVRRALFEEDRSADGELRMSIWSGNASICKGEEILVSYGKSWWRERSHSS